MHTSESDALSGVRIPAVPTIKRVEQYLESHRVNISGGPCVAFEHESVAGESQEVDGRRQLIAGEIGVSMPCVARKVGCSSF